MRILDLVLTYHYYDMIDVGDKREEYRGIYPHWIKRLLWDDECDERVCLGEINYITALAITNDSQLIHFRDLGFTTQNYTHVRFHRGYSNTVMLWSIEGISIGRGKKEWGAPNELVFIIKLGKRYESRSA